MSANLNLAAFGDYWGKVHPSRVAVHAGGADLTWDDLRRRSNPICLDLLDRNVGLGDAVAVLLSNRIEYIVVVQAAMRVGAVVVPLNMRLTGDEIAHQVSDCRATCLLTERALTEKTLIATAANKHMEVVVIDEDVRPTCGGSAADGVTTAFVAGDEALFYAYTSGTTGRPKAAVLSHRGVIETGVARNALFGLSYDDTVLCVAQLGVAGTLVAIWCQTCLLAGATMYLEPSFEPARALDVLETKQITTMIAPTVFWQRIASEPAFPHANLSSLRRATVGGARVPADLVRQFHAKGVRLVQSYGMTEVSAMVSCVSPLAFERGADSAGPPLYNTKIRIVDRQNLEVASGKCGEILVRSPGVLREYLGNARATREAFLEGWYRTGDIGSVDRDGFLRLVDRSGDMLISGGFNVYPAEIERVLAGVTLFDLAVIGVEDDRWGQVPMIILGKEGADTPDFVVMAQACKTSLADYKRPRYAVVLDEPLPKNSLGKVMKGELRERFRVPPDDAVRLWELNQDTSDARRQRA
jgi:acyl-CoA synthetase (AMP-forming)/AMP-acid ligase II